MRERILTTILSAILPGVGQIYYHDWIKGVGFLLGAILLSGMVRREIMGAPGALAQLLPFASVYVIHLVLISLAVWSAMDAYRRSQKG